MADINAIIDQLSGLTVLEAADLVKQLESKWGVSAAAAVAAAGPAAAAAAPAEAQTEFTVVLAKAGDKKIAYQACDDATAQAASWDSAKCTANANAYVAEKSLIGIIGTFNSGCAKLVIPILNPAPLAMVSPARNSSARLAMAAVPRSPASQLPGGKLNRTCVSLWRCKRAAISSGPKA